VRDHGLTNGLRSLGDEQSRPGTPDAPGQPTDRAHPVGSRVLEPAR
jgi:hypothetical protein